MKRSGGKKKKKKKKENAFGFIATVVWFEQPDFDDHSLEGDQAPSKNRRTIDR